MQHLGLGGLWRSYNSQLLESVAGPTQQSLTTARERRAAVGRANLGVFPAHLLTSVQRHMEQRPRTDPLSVP